MLTLRLGDQKAVDLISELNHFGTKQLPPNGGRGKELSLHAEGLQPRGCVARWGASQKGRNGRRMKLSEPTGNEMPNTPAHKDRGFTHYLSRALGG